MLLVVRLCQLSHDVVAKWLLGSNLSQFQRRQRLFPFTWANRSVHSLGKWYSKYRTGKFNPGNRVYHLYKSNPFTEKRPRKHAIIDRFDEMEHNLRLEHPDRENRTSFQMFPRFRYFLACGAGVLRVGETLFYSRHLWFYDSGRLRRVEY